MSELAQVCQEIAVCQQCELSQSRKKAVPGEGPEDADLIFIGEAPGFHENEQGRPFVGAAGNFLEELLASIGLNRNDVYITNVVKCRPPGNRDPLVKEVEACRPYLHRQIELIKPKMIVTLGRYSMESFFPGAKISRIHGQPRRMEDIIYYPMYHPAAALHQPRYRTDIEQDMLKIPEILAEAQKVEEMQPPESAEQLSLF
ncbi:MAG: uracil-DNA glycosylase [Anaerolineae bacterium]